MYYFTTVFLYFTVVLQDGFHRGGETVTQAGSHLSHFGASTDTTVRGQAQGLFICAFTL